MEEYLRRSQAFQKRLSIQALSRREARYLLFRMAGPLMQAKFPSFVNLSQVPVTFLHGNPHLDNYVKTFRGSAMMDFDRSRMGPYCWDIIRFLASLSLRRDENQGFLDRKVVECFVDAYIIHFLHPEIPAKKVKMLKNAAPEKWQVNTEEYLKSGKRWARKMREHKLSRNHPQALNILDHFLATLPDSHLLEEFKVDEMGLTPGSLGKKHFIYSLVPKDPDSYQDPILLDIKEVYEEKDSKYFYNPFPHHGQRMIEASRIYAAGMEARQGFCTVDNKQYWGRQIPSFAVKVKKYLDKGEQCDVAYSVGSELGKGHRKGLKNPAEADMVYEDFQNNFDHYLKVSRYFANEIAIAFDMIMVKLKLEQDYRSW